MRKCSAWMATQDQPHENLIFPKEVLPHGNAKNTCTLRTNLKYSNIVRNLIIQVNNDPATFYN